MLRKYYILLIIIIMAVLISNTIRLNIKSVVLKDDINKPNISQLSIYMSFAELTEAIGSKYSLETHNSEYVGKYTDVIYDGLTVSFFHNNTEMITEQSKIGHVIITSNNYTFSNGFLVGEKAIDVINRCEYLYENAYSIHQSDYMIDVFNYREFSKSGKLVDTNFKIKWSYNDDSMSFTSKDQITNNITIAKVIIYIELD